jgi:hypothetical protein
MTKVPQFVTTRRHDTASGSAAAAVSESGSISNPYEVNPAAAEEFLVAYREVVRKCTLLYVFLLIKE